MINGCLMELQHNFCKIMFYIVPQDAEVRSFNDLMVWVCTLLKETVLLYSYFYISVKSVRRDTEIPLSLRYVLSVPVLQKHSRI